MRSGSAWPGVVGAVAAWTILGPARASVPPDTPPPAVAPPAAPAVPSLAAPEGDAAPQTLPLGQDPSTRLTLAVMVDGKGPYAFLVDTGSDRTSISAELAAVLVLPPGPKVIIHGSGGADPARTVVIDSLTIGNRTVRHIEAPALSAKDLGADGMLGVDALRDLHLVMDFKALRLSSSPSRAEPVDEHTIVVRGKSRYGQLILAN